MRWEELTGDEFPLAVERAAGVCLMPCSVVERHGHHLPLGTDMYIGREVCRRAAAVEPAIIFPDNIFGQIEEARHVPGTIAFPVSLSLQFLDAACDEIARNGLRKIVLVNSHGGNSYLLALFAQAQLERPRPYTLYVVDPILMPFDDPEIAAQWETTTDGHAGESETSQILAIRPDLVRLDACRADDEGMPQGRLDALRAAGVYTGIWWYADHPTHYRGEGRAGTAAKGDFELQRYAERLAAALHLIKQDTETPRLLAEFYGRTEH